MTFNLRRLNKRFRKAGEKILAFRWFFIILMTLLVFVSFIGIQKVELNSSWDSWFFDDDPITVAKHRFEEIFGNSDAGAILVKADDVFSHDVLTMIQELSRELEDNVPFVDKIVSLTQFEFSQGTREGITISNLVPDEIPRDKKQLEEIRSKAFAKKSMTNWLFSDDSTETWIQVRLKEIPESFKREQKNKSVEPLYVIGQEIHRIIHQEKYNRFNLMEAGMPSVAFDKTNYFTSEAGRIILFAIGASIILLLLFARSFRGVVVPLITTISAILISYGAMGFLGIQIDVSMITVPIYLAMAVSIGYSIHILNFFKRRFIETGNRKEAVLYAIEHTGWPLFFTALTTIGCMLSFNFTDITAISWVGNASAAMVTVVYVFVMVLNPALLSFGKNREPASKEDIKAKTLLKSDRIFESLGNWVLRNGKKIAVVSFILIAALIYGIKDVTADLEPFKSYGLRVPYIKRQYDITHSKIGTMYSYNLTIELPKRGQAKEPETLKNFERLEAEVKKLPLTKKTMSILDIIKDMNQTMHGDNETYYRIPDNRDLVSQLLLLYENSGGKDAEYWMDYDYQILRLQVGVSNFKASEVERELGITQELVTKYFPGARGGMVGTFVEGAVVNNYIARGQVKTFFFALIIIGVLMIIVFRSVKAGLIGLLPNLVPVAVIGGIMGYFGLAIDMMSMTIVPMIMGISVDDSIHFVNHIKLEVERNAGYDEAIRRSFRTVGKALFMTTVILIATFGMYISSIVLFYKVLGLLVCLGLTSALVADYLLTPILIKWTKPFGKESEILAELTVGKSEELKN